MKTTYLSNVTINIDKKYSRSYGNPIDVKYPLAKISGNWIFLIDDNGFDDGKMNITGKHFNSHKGREIKESTFNNTQSKLYKKYLAERDNRNAKQQKEDEKNAKIYATELNKAIKVVKKEKAFFKDYYDKNKGKMRGGLGSHKASTFMAFKLASKFKLQITPLKDALKKVF